MRCILVLAFISIFFLSGCANTGAKFNQSAMEIAPTDKALVYFYRLSAFQAGGATFPVIANGEKIGTLDNGAYFYKVISPGVYKINSDTLGIDRVATMSFEAGKVHFVRCFIEMGMWTNSIRFMQVHQDEALPEINKTEVQLY